MERKPNAFWILGLIVSLNCARFASAQSSTPLPQPVATLDVSQSLPEESGELTLATVAFSSKNSIAVEIFRPVAQGPQFAQYVVQWESGSFKRIAQTHTLQWGGTSSADGSRKLIEYSERIVPRFQHLLGTLHTIATLGMSGPEDANREAVRVIDTATRKSCFEWRRSFPMSWSRARFATISPSGELVAITVDNTLSIYQLPVVCDGSTKMRK